jgi:hypothetical protein
MKTEQFRKEIEEAINRNSMENGSDTPNFILADYLRDCLTTYDRTVKAREKWYGRSLKNDQSEAPPVNGTPGPAYEELVATIDMLGVALAGHNHTWTPEQRSAYERATTQAPNFY